MSSPGQSRIRILDGMRGVSILLVIISHASVCDDIPQTWRHLIAWIPSAQFGVRAFFVISGFIITHLLLKEETKTSRISLPHFYARRALRLLPALWVFIGAVCAYDVYATDVSLPAKVYWAALTFTTGIWPEGSWMLGHTWSLAVEQQFYILWPVALVSLGARGRIIFCCALIVGAPMFRVAFYGFITPGRIPYVFPCEMDHIMWGCLSAFLTREGTGESLAENLRRYLRHPAVLWVTLGVMLGMHWLDVAAALGEVTVPFGGTVQSAGIAIILASLLLESSGFLGKAFSNAALVLVGTISYSLYLWQQPFLGSNELGVRVSFPWNLVMAIAVATASYLLLERSWLSLKDRIHAKSAGSVASVYGGISAGRGGKV